MSIGVEESDAQIGKIEVADYCGSSRHDDESEAALLRRYGVKVSDVEATPDATVFGRSEKQNRPVSVRKVAKHQPFSMDAARREIAALEAIQGPSVPALLEELETDSTLWYVVESRPGMSLRAGVEAHGPLPEDAVKSIVPQLFVAIASIFNAGFAHLRISSDTIFIDTEGRVTLHDFRHAYKYSDERDGKLYAVTSEKCGDDIYTAPEAFSSLKYNARKAVIWSCGVVVYFMTTGQTDKLAALAHASFDSQESMAATPSSSRRKLSTGSLPVIPYPQNRFSVPNWARDIISKMLRSDPLQRAELIEVAAKVPKEIMVKEARPLMELAWLDYKTHVGPLAGLTPAENNDSASSMFSFSRFSTFSKDSLGPLLPGRRRSSVAKASGREEPSSPGKRRYTIFS